MNDPVIILTRPHDDSVRFLAKVEALTGPVKSCVAPLMQIDPVPAMLGADVTAVIITSRHGAAQSRLIGVPAGMTAYCVGEKTTQAARDAGLSAIMAGETAEALVEKLSSDPLPGRLCHMRGRHVQVPVAARLSAAGMRCDELVVYDQRALAPNPQLLTVLNGDAPVILPLFSPRSAAMIPPLRAPAHIIAMSRNIAKQFSAVPVQSLEIVQKPHISAMILAVCNLWTQLVKR